MNKPAIWSVSSRQLCSYVKCLSSLGDGAVYVGHVRGSARPKPRYIGHLTGSFTMARMDCKMARK